MKSGQPPGRFNKTLVLVVASGITAGAACWFLSMPAAARALWGATTTVALIPLAYSVVKTLRQGRLGVDLIALLAMATALVLGEYLAGAVVALMLSGGQTLEDYAASRARREISRLLERAPRIAHRYENGVLATRSVDEISPGDLLLVKPGEVLPTDGLVFRNPAVLDESTLTGEALPVDREVGEKVHSGTVNAGGPFELRATASAAESTYAGIIRLVQEAQASKAPLVRMADRYALWFLFLTVGLATLAWLLSGDPVRLLTVLVVATPCPLILAAPVAIVSGISRAARHGIMIKGGGALETLARAEILFLDKTGTITTGRPTLSETIPLDGLPPDQLLRLAASLDQVSTHTLAEALVRAARRRGLQLAFPTQVQEEAGTGIRGWIDGRLVAIGSADWVVDTILPAQARSLRVRAALEGSSSVFVAVDGILQGVLLFEDPVRPESPSTIRSLRRAGIKKVILLTGDHPELAGLIGSAVGVDRVLAERTPSEKVKAIRLEGKGSVTVMAGDGINDAPALAAAHVGVAMGARGATAASESADVVLMVDRFDRLERALKISQRSRRIALQSIIVGIGLSLGAMLLALAGFFTPVSGAFLQEGIDVVVILNALRALSEERRGRPRASSRQSVARARTEHSHLLPGVRALRTLADRLDRLEPEAALEELRATRTFLVDELMPHEEQEESTLYPMVARLMGGDDPTGTMSRAHLEISHLIRLFSARVDGLPEEGPGEADKRDLRRLLYGLEALLRLHFSQEEDHYFALFDSRENR